MFEIDKPRQNKLHPTEKPVDLVAPMLVNSTPRGGVVFDCFLGSGTTLLACENTGRAGRGVEIDPGYIAVALQRMADAFPALDIRRAG